MVIIIFILSFYAIFFFNVLIPLALPGGYSDIRNIVIAIYTLTAALIACTYVICEKLDKISDTNKQAKKFDSEKNEL